MLLSGLEEQVCCREEVLRFQALWRCGRVLTWCSRLLSLLEDTAGREAQSEPTKLLKKLVVTRRAEDNAKMQKMKDAPSDIRSLDR